jgi:ABC-2 type transport system ATP-binding protein
MALPKSILKYRDAFLKAGIVDDLRLELVVDPDASLIETPQFTGTHVIAGNRITTTVPASLAGQAATWAQDLRRTGRIEEFSLAPATLEDAYVALVGATSALDNSSEETDVRAA